LHGDLVPRGIEEKVRLRVEPALGRPVNGGVKTTLQPTPLFRVSLLFATAAGFLSVPLQSQAASRWETLEAIHWIENPHNSPRPGPHGELGPYQFLESTWRMYTDLPFERALDRTASDEVAVRHYEWLKSALVRNGVEPTPFNIGLAWNAGIGSVLRGKAPSASRDYATRVRNLSAELHARTETPLLAAADDAPSS
jgi:hypothetical protein